MNILKVGPIEKLTTTSEEASDYARHIWYDARNGRLAATNGHALIISAIEPEPGDIDGLISIEAIQYARSLRLRSGAGVRWFSIRCDDPHVLEFADSTRMLRPQGEFPDYASIVPQVSGPPTVTFNPELLARIVAAFPKQEIGKKGTNPGSISLWVTQSSTDTCKNCGIKITKTNNHGWWHDNGQIFCNEQKEKIAEPAKTSPTPVVVKAHYDGGLAVLMPVSGMDPAKWNTELPCGRKS